MFIDTISGNVAGNGLRKPLYNLMFPPSRRAERGGNVNIRLFSFKIRPLVLKISLETTIPRRNQGETRFPRGKHADAGSATEANPAFPAREMYVPRASGSKSSAGNARTQRTDTNAAPETQ